MRTHPMPPIRLSASDHAVLERLVETSASGRDADLAERLSVELARAQVLPDGELPARVAGLGSWVEFREAGAGQPRRVQLVLPREADAARGRVSVLAPMGCALLGLAPGQRIDWPVPGGRQRTIEVLAVEREDA